jgi:hypothetical protein
MWLLVLLCLVNAGVNSKSFLFEYRLNIAGMPINPLDFLLLLGLIIAMFARGSRRTITPRPHPLFAPTLALLTAALIFGAVMGMRNLSHGLTLYQYVTFIRNFAVLPMGLIVGYRLVPHLRAAYFYRWVVLACGVSTGVLIILFFAGKGEQLGESGNIDLLRALNYVAAYPAIAGSLLFFTVLCGPRILFLPATIVVGGFCLVGNFATLNRSDWISTVACLSIVFTLLPKGQRLAKALKGAIFAGVLLIFLLIGVYATSRLTGMDFAHKMESRIRSLLPGEQEGVKQKAWATRIPGSLRELELWLDSPIVGEGFGIQSTLNIEFTDVWFGFRHDSWTCILAETGLIGFAGAVLLVGGCFVVGRRMARERTDRASVLVGVTGVVTATYYFVLGASSGGFTNQRGGLALAIACGIVLRTRQMQLATLNGQLEQFDPSDTNIQTDLPPDADYAPGSASPDYATATGDASSDYY